MSQGFSPKKNNFKGDVKKEEYSNTEKDAQRPLSQWTTTQMGERDATGCKNSSKTNEGKRAVKKSDVASRRSGRIKRLASDQMESPSKQTRGLTEALDSKVKLARGKKGRNSDMKGAVDGSCCHTGNVTTRGERP